jgi:hypothetical protein
LLDARRQVTGLQTDKNALLAAHAAEMSKLQNAQTKALDTLMSVQEENDILRGAVANLTAAQQQQQQHNDQT